MTDIDKELAQALSESEAQDTGVEIPAKAEEASTPPRRNLGLLIGLLVMGGAVLCLVFFNSTGAAIYSLSVDKLLAQKSELGSRKVRVQGHLVSGSLQKRQEPCEYRFHMHSAGQELEVRYPQCVVPDTFRDVQGMPVEVTAEGKVVGDHLEATQIFAKCPSKYEMQNKAQDLGFAPEHGGGAPAVMPTYLEPETIR
jgi:cytochrome c-type biogenesis protein CcmE